MAARHLDEGLLGWFLTAVAIVGGLAACGTTAYFGARLALAVDNNIAPID